MGARLSEIEGIQEALARIEAALAEGKQERLAADRMVLGRIDAAVAESKQEWMATEKLVLAVMQEPGGQCAPISAADTQNDRDN